MKAHRKRIAVILVGGIRLYVVGISGESIPWRAETLKASLASGPSLEDLAEPHKIGVAAALRAVPANLTSHHRLALRRAALDAYEAAGARQNGGNFEVSASDPMECEELYRIFLKKAYEVYEPFQLAAGNSRKVWGYVTNNVTHVLTMHDHKRTAEINGVTYVSLPDTGTGLGMLTQGELRKVRVVEDVFYFWPSAIVHTPLLSRSPLYRIVLNMEIRTASGSTPALQANAEAATSDGVMPGLSYKELTLNVPDRKATMYLRNVGAESLMMAYIDRGELGAEMEFPATYIAPGSEHDVKTYLGHSFIVKSISLNVDPTYLVVYKATSFWTCNDANRVVSCDEQKRRMEL